MLALTKCTKTPHRIPRSLRESRNSMRCCRFFKRAASFEQPVNLIVQRFRAGAAGKRSPEQRVLYQLVEQQIDDPDVLGIYTSGKQQITGDSLVTDPESTFNFPNCSRLCGTVCCVRSRTRQSFTQIVFFWISSTVKAATGKARLSARSSSAHPSLSFSSWVRISSFSGHFQTGPAASEDRH